MATSDRLVMWRTTEFLQDNMQWATDQNVYRKKGSCYKGAESDEIVQLVNLRDECERMQERVEW